MQTVMQTSINKLLNNGNIMKDNQKNKVKIITLISSFILIRQQFCSYITFKTVEDNDIARLIIFIWKTWK